MQDLTLEDIKSKLDYFKKSIYDIPDDFIINSEYIGTLSKKDFIQALKLYRDIIVYMYNDAAQNPSLYGYSTISKKTNEEKLYDEFTSKFTYMDKLAQIHLIINRICNSSELNNGILEVDINLLKENLNLLPRIKSPDKLIKKLCENGFVFEGYTGKISSTNSLKIYHVDNKNIMEVIKNLSQSKYASFGMEYDYSHFNYRIFTIGKNENLPINELYVFDTLSEKARDFLINFNTAMNNEGYFYGVGATSGLCWGVSQFAYSRFPEKKKQYVCRLYQRGENLVIRLFLNKIDTYSEYINNSPEYIKASFIDDFGKCNYCREVCKCRKTYTINNFEYNKCDGITFEFYNLQLESIEYYINLLRFSAGKMK